MKRASTTSAACSWTSPSSAWPAWDWPVSPWTSTAPCHPPAGTPRAAPSVTTRNVRAPAATTPLFCTIAQTAQVLDFLHRSGNVHDSHGAQEVIWACIQEVRQALPGITIEVRMDRAFFSDEIVSYLQQAGLEFTVSVPFERFAELKGLIEARQRWPRVNSEVSHFEADWKPKVWDRRLRFLFIRTRACRQHKGPIQLDLFIPHGYGYDFKVIVTHKTLGAHPVVRFHEGRGSQEGILAELKSHCQMGYVPVRGRCGNPLYLLAGLFAHNLTRELQMATAPPCRHTTAHRP